MGEDGNERVGGVDTQHAMNSSWNSTYHTRSMTRREMMSEAQINQATSAHACSPPPPKRTRSKKKRYPPGSIQQQIVPKNPPPSAQKEPKQRKRSGPKFSHRYCRCKKCGCAYISAGMLAKHEKKCALYLDLSRQPADPESCSSSSSTARGRPSTHSAPPTVETADDGHAHFHARASTRHASSVSPPWPDCQVESTHWSQQHQLDYTNDYSTSCDGQTPYTDNGSQQGAIYADQNTPSNFAGAIGDDGHYGLKGAYGGDQQTSPKPEPMPPPCHHFYTNEQMGGNRGNHGSQLWSEAPEGTFVDQYSPFQPVVYEPYYPSEDSGGSSGGHSTIVYFNGSSNSNGSYQSTSSMDSRLTEEEEAERTLCSASSDATAAGAGASSPYFNNIDLFVDSGKW